MPDIFTYISSDFLSIKSRTGLQTMKHFEPLLPTLTYHWCSFVYPVHDIFLLYYFVGISYNHINSFPTDI